MNKKEATLLILVAGLAVTLLVSGKNERKNVVSSTDLSSSATITCTYNQTLNANYVGSEISHNLPDPEKQALIFTFSQFKNSETGQLSYLDATKTITTIPIIKLIENTDKMVYIDGTGENYLTIHTIYKKLGIATYAKNVDLLGIPSATLAMGTCVPY